MNPKNSKTSSPRVLLLNQYFYPDVAATAQFMTELSEDLTEFGLDVDVLRGTVQYDEMKNQNVSRKASFDEVTIHRSFAMNLGGDGTLTHFANYSAFNVSAPLRSIALPSYDIVLAFTDPPLIGLTGTLLKKLKGAKFVQFVADLYPDVAIELGYLDKRSLLARFANRAARFMFEQTDSIIVLGHHMKKRVQKKGEIDPETISIIRNWADSDNIYPVQPSENWFIEEQNLGDKFVVQYSGHIGAGHDFSAVIETARSLKDNNQIIFQFIGEGPGKEELLEAKRKHNLDNFRFLPYQDKSDLAYTLSSADVALVSLREGLEGLMVPSKIYGILASGSPAIFLGNENSEISRIIEQGNCGFSIPPSDGKQLEEVLLKLYDNTELVQELGGNARDYFLENFQREMITQRYYDLLVNLV